jgi:hypothetical protein
LGTGCWENIRVKRDEVVGGLRKMDNEELNKLYSLSNKIRMIKSRGMRWAGHVARMGRRGMQVGFLWGILKESDHLEDLDINGRIILE